MVARSTQNSLLDLQLSFIPLIEGCRPFSAWPWQLWQGPCRSEVLALVVAAMLAPALVNMLALVNTLAPATMLALALVARLWPGRGG